MFHQGHMMRLQPSPTTGMERILQRQQEADAAVADLMAMTEAPTAPVVTPLAAHEHSANPFRPNTLSAIIGQTPAKTLMRAAISSAKRSRRPLDHVLLVGQSGYGKTTFATAIGHDMGVDVYQVEAPISYDTLMQLREVMRDGDILFIDELHQQGIMERRGRESSTQPEVLFSVMEDRTIPTQTGVLTFPAITLVGATTDEGRLPDAFVNRFPLRPVLVSYTEADLIVMAQANARVLRRSLTTDAAARIARASRGVPREVNNLVRNAALQPAEPIDAPAVDLTLELIGVTRDGLTRDMQAMLRFLYLKARRVVRGEERFQASVNTIATGIGKSRDSKAIGLRVEPFLIEQGYVQVASGGRELTDAGVERAKGLCNA